MIDHHCHILPDVDDGAQSKTHALAMARQAVNEGITSIVATPHHRIRNWDNPKDTVFKNVEHLNELLKEEEIPLTVLPGQEPRVFGEMVEAYHTGELLSVNNNHKYILVEFPSNHVPRYAERLLYNLQLEGLTPVIVHPERNSEIVKNPDVLYALIRGGALSQVTAGSLAGQFGKKLKKFSLDLVENSLTHIIASDAHNTDTRPFYMAEAFQTIESEFGQVARYLFEENAELLIEGLAVQKEPPEPIRTKKFLGLF